MFLPLLLNRTSVLRQVSIAGPVTITPTLGAELLTDPGLETWASATNLTSWEEVLAGTSTVNRDADAHGGSFAARVDIDASNSVGSIRQLTSVLAGTWLRASAYAKSNPTSAVMRLDFGGFTGNTQTFTAAYAQYLQTGRAVADNKYFTLSRSSAASKSVYWDDVSLKAITFSTTLYTLSDAFVPRVIRAAITRTANTQAGVAHYSDDNNLVLAYLDGAGNVKLDKRTTGTWANVATAAVTYGAGKVLQLAYDPVAQTYAVTYDGTAVISGASVTDAVFQGAKGSRLFSTYDSNAFSAIYAAER